MHDGGGDDVVHRAAVGRQRAIEHAAGQHPQRGDGDHHDADDDGADDKRTAQGAFVAKTHAAYDRLGQGEGEDAHEHPLRGIEPKRHLAACQRVEKLGAVVPDALHDGLPAAAGSQQPRREHDDAHEHRHAAQRVGGRHAAKAADGGVDDHRHAEQGKSCHVALSGHGLEYLGAAYELGDHHRDEEAHNHGGAQVCERVRAVARADDVDHGDGAELAADQRELFAHDAVEQKERRRLHGRHVDPAKSDLPGLTRAAYKRADRAVGGHRRHGQDEAAERAVGDEVLGCKSGAACARARAHPGGKRDRDGEEGYGGAEGEQGVVHGRAPFSAGLASLFSPSSSSSSSKPTSFITWQAIQIATPTVNRKVPPHPATTHSGVAHT